MLIESTPSTNVELLTFEVAGRRFGIRGAQVREVQRAASLLAPPDEQARLDGLLNLRGRVTPVFNLRAWFELPSKPVEHTDLFVVCEANGKLLAVRADGNVELAVATAGLASVPDGMFTAGIVDAVAKTAGGLVLLVDPERLLATGQETR